MQTKRTLRIAGIQAESRNLDIEGNLSRAERLVAIAAGRGAKLALCPELLAAGYTYDPSLWEAAEERGGPTERWLLRMAVEHGLYIGASYLEASGGDFYNTFALASPRGDIAGRVRKESLPAFEGWFFRSSTDPKVIETDFGRVGVGICQDSHTARFMRRVREEGIDLLLMPHSGPCLAGPLGEETRRMLSEVSGFYAKTFGVPAVMVNKAAGLDSYSPVPLVPLLKLRLHFPGGSAIADSDGVLRERLGEEEGVVVADVVLDPARRRRPEEIPDGYWAKPPRLFPKTSAALFVALEWIGKAAYAMSPSRRAAARKRAGG